MGETAYEEGMLAYDNEKGRFENPYSRYADCADGTNFHSDWLDGWLEQRSANT